MRSFTEIYPKYSDYVDLYAVSLDRESTVEEVLQFGEDMELNYPIVFSGVSMVPNFNVKQQATKVVLDEHGIVVYRGGMGKGNPDEYESVFAELAESAKAAN